MSVISAWLSQGSQAWKILTVQIELMKNAPKALKMPFYLIKLLKMATSGRPDQSDKIELMKNANLMSK